MAPFNDDSDQWKLGEKVLRDFHITGRYRAFFDDDDNLVVNRNRFLDALRLTYYPERGRIVAEQRQLPFRQVLTSAHFRAGWVYPYFADLAWAVFVDLVALATLVWIASGLFIWTKLKRLHFWGWVSLGAGMASFAAVVLAM